MGNTAISLTSAVILRRYLGIPHIRCFKMEDSTGLGFLRRKVQSLSRKGSASSEEANEEAKLSLLEKKISSQETEGNCNTRGRKGQVGDRY